MPWLEQLEDRRLLTATVEKIDVNTNALGSYPTAFVEFDGTIQFRAGGAFYTTDGTETGVELVKDIALGNWGSAFSFFDGPREFNGKLYFAADTCPGCVDYELWSTDGTQAGTQIVKNINATERARGGNLSSTPLSLTIVNGSLFFTANDVVHGTELWMTDGTEMNTVLVKDIAPGVNAAYPGSLLAIDGTLFFTAGDGVTGAELWKSDGTSDGTTLVADINPTGDSLPADFMSVGGELLFVADDGSHGFELWRSDGTPEGTWLVSDINPGTASSVSPSQYFFPHPPLLVNVDDQVYFSADDGVLGTELWQSDGTAAGTALLADVIPGSEGSEPRGIAAVGGNLYFTAPADGFRELFKIDLSLVDRLPGDADGDGKVAFTDFLILSSNFGKEGTYADGDFDGNGHVEFDDFQILSSNFGRSASPAVIAAARATDHALAVDMAFAQAIDDADLSHLNEDDGDAISSLV